MDEIERIANQLSRIIDGDPWYGSNIADVLHDLTARQAAHRPIPQAHTIWEIALHITTWNREVLRRLRTGVARDPEDGDWPEQPEATEENWRWTVDVLEASFRDLLAAVSAFPAARLDEVLGEERDRPLGSGVSFYVLLHGIVQHNVAHTAQMSLLKKAVL
ncbi:MAG: DinB family protein [Longimicrobiaceae bacterium]